jgi:orotate phosphoribosyltransferase
MNLKQIGKKIALHQLTVGAIKIQPEKPFTWASGWKSPIYNDNRRLLYYPDMVNLIRNGFDIPFEEKVTRSELIIAGTATAGIPHASMFAYAHSLPMVYVREKQKDHGMESQIEGIDPLENFEGKTVLVMEDLISTGGSSAAVVQALRNRGAVVTNCFSIFNYGFPKAQDMFAGKIPFRGEETLTEPCAVSSLLDYPLLLEVAITHGFINKEQEEFLHSWSANPQKWSDEWKTAHPE